MTDIETAARAEAERRVPMPPSKAIEVTVTVGALIDSAHDSFVAGAAWQAAQQSETRAGLDPKFVETAIGRGQQLVDRWNHASDEMSVNGMIRWADAAEEALTRLLAIARNVAAVEEGKN